MMAFMKIVNGTTHSLEYCKNTYGFDVATQEEGTVVVPISKDSDKYGDNDKSGIVNIVRIPETGEGETKTVYFDYNAINIILFGLIMLTTILNLFVCCCKWLQNKSL